MKRLIPILGCALLLAIASFFALSFMNWGPWAEKPPCACALPPKISWKLHHEHLSVEDTNGLFAIKHINLSEEQFRFFYVLKTPHTGTPHIEVIARTAENDPTPTLLANTVQPLGELNEYAVGVITTDHVNRKGQSLTFQITLPGQNEPAWQQTILTQIAEDDKKYGPVLTYSEFDSVVPKDITYDARIYVENDQPRTYAHFVLTKPDETDVYVFMSMDDAGPVQTLTREEYKGRLDDK